MANKECRASICKELLHINKKSQTTPENTFIRIEIQMVNMKHETVIPTGYRTTATKTR